MFRWHLMKRALPMALSLCLTVQSVPATAYASEYRNSEIAQVSEEAASEENVEETVLMLSDPVEFTLPSDSSNMVKWFDFTPTEDRYYVFTVQQGDSQVKDFYFNLYSYLLLRPGNLFDFLHLPVIYLSLTAF